MLVSHSVVQNMNYNRIQFRCVHYGVVLNYINPQISGLSNPLKHTRRRKNLLKGGVAGP